MAGAAASRGTLGAVVASLFKFLGGFLGLFAIAMFGFALIAAGDDDSPSSVKWTASVFGLISGIPGVWVWRKGAARRRQAQVLQDCTALVRTRDRFTARELAEKLGQTEVAAELLIGRVTEADNGIDLVYHRSTSEYFQRAALGEGAVTPDHCDACGAPSREVFLPGEPVICGFCKKAMVA